MTHDCPPPSAAIALPPASTIADDVARALAEDLGTGDVSAALVPDRPCQAVLTAKEPCVLAGSAWFDACLQSLDPDVEIIWTARDGTAIAAGASPCRIRGHSRALLSAERCALNFLQTLSATATTTAHYVAAIAGTRARLLDTRKTLPGLRAAQKYAVRAGGGGNHRIGLHDAVMIKENHIHALGSIAGAVASARRRYPSLPLIVEVEDLDQLEQALAAGPDRILIDNFRLADMRRAVAIAAGRIPLEASGGTELDAIRAIAETGVDFISVGALTKHVRAIDFSLRFSDRHD